MPTSSNRDEPLPLLSDVHAQHDANFQIVCYDPNQKDKPCPICGGLGVIKLDVPIDNADFGKLHRCPNRPARADAEHLERLKKISNLGAFAHKTFHNFDTQREGYSQHENHALYFALQNAQRFAEHLNGWLLLQGGYGCGKTHLAAAIANDRLQRGETVIFVTAPDLLDHLRQSYQADGGDSYSASFDRLRAVSLLILDDLGTENQSEWAKEKLFQLLNHRYNHQLPTVITSNMPMESFDPRLKSRFGDNRMVQIHVIDAPDFRSTSNTQRRADLFSRLSRYANMTFDAFDMQTKLTPEERDNLQRAAHAAFEYAREPRGWFLLMGHYGVGKTHLAAAIGNYLQAQGQKVVLITVPDLMDHLRTTFDHSTDISFGTLFTKIKESPVLILDDLGTEAPSAWVQEKLFQILDYRYVGNLTTVLTTSKPQLEDLNERVASRLADSQRCRRFAIKMRVSYAKRMNR